MRPRPRPRRVRPAQSRGRRAGPRQSPALRRLGARHRRRAARRARHGGGARRRRRQGLRRRDRAPPGRARARPRRARRRDAIRRWACCRAFPMRRASPAIWAAAASSWCRSARAAPAPAATLPIGPLRLQALADDEKRLKDAIDKQLQTVPWICAREPTANFYAVGGAWRALARLHMEQSQYPLHIIQAYTLPRARGRELSRAGGAPVAQIAGAHQHDLEEAARGGAAGGAHPAAAPQADRAQGAGVLGRTACARAISTACSTRPSSAPIRWSPPASSRPSSTRASA